MRVAGKQVFVRDGVVFAVLSIIVFFLSSCGGGPVPVVTTSTATGSSTGTTTGSTPPQTTPTQPVVLAKPKFGYTGNQGASLSGYQVDPSSGELTPLSGFPLALGGNPEVIAHDPQNRFLIVGDIAMYQLHVMSIDPATGALMETKSSPVPTVKEPVGIVVDPTGTHVYVASMSNDNKVGAYNLSSSGALTPISGSPFSTDPTVGIQFSIAMNSAGTFLYVLDLTQIYVFSVDPTTGALTLRQTVTGPSSGNELALDTGGNYLYAVGTGTNSILTYSIDSASGQLTQTKSSPMVERNGAYTISVSPTGQFAYTIENNNYLVSYAISNGSFAPVGKVYSGVYGSKVAVDPSGSFVYVPQACSYCSSGIYNVIHEFSIGSSGALTPLPVSSVAAGVTPWGMTITTQ